MKTFGVFLLIWLASIFITFYSHKGSSVEELVKMIMATQIAYIMYKLAKEESKN